MNFGIIEADDVLVATPWPTIRIGDQYRKSFGRAEPIWPQSNHACNDYQFRWAILWRWFAEAQAKNNGQKPRKPINHDARLRSCIAHKYKKVLKSKGAFSRSSGPSKEVVNRHIKKYLLKHEALGILSSLRKYFNSELINSNLLYIRRNH